ncbi:hypothetical protein ACFP7A_14145 [Sporolactobacillus kofuensis]|uniref:Uncharacterized protein n=1 Tax=Sporolactobacillus kofuensis TaxID=269672 RepID=A0ABW1WI09_9BACL|nr:hypothetical protein [Sporolactobacillus kofuensis]MCO7177178.1 hypothetical protein [Sporolactobacillus kofuensis]
MNLKEFQLYVREEFNVEMTLHEKVVADLKAINKGSRNSILAVIVRRIREGVQFVPDGVAKSLEGKLSGYAKIKPRAMNLRVVYRPIVHKDYIEMYLLAIGPRDHKKVYQMAAERL